MSAAAAPLATSPAPRVGSVDLLRGLIMVVMVLDHTRDFIGDLSIDPTDLGKTTVALFLTRWVTHYCAPVFVLLAGTGAYLMGTRGKTKRELALFLFTRGLWLIFLELTVARFGLTFDPTFGFLPLIVLWVIGLSMIVMAPLVFLPIWTIAAFGLILIFGHNALDRFDPEMSGLAWSILHKRGLLGTVAGRPIFLLYPLVPWVSVMAAGYALGTLFGIDSKRRRAWLIGLGLASIALFVGLRWSNLYGDPRPWTTQADPTFTLLSFINCEKYPPSLLYLLMTLGPALVFLGIFDGGLGKLGRPLVTLGRVPLFFYLLQWFTIHLTAILVGIITGQPTRWLIGNGPFEAPPGYGHGLPIVYLMWVVNLLLMYPACAWFADLKRRRRDAWLSYF